jgi:hypothetical protein
MSRTNDRRQKTERLDIAIDRAVREMLDVEPPAGLRGQVLERIERPRTGLRWTWVVAPLAAAAIVVLAIMMPSRQAPVVPARNVVAAKVPQPAVAQTPSPTVTTAATVPGPAPRMMPAAASGQVFVAEAVTAASTDVGIEPLSPIDPIGIVPVRPATISPSEIAIAPLAPIAALQVEPLTPPDRRN